MSRTQSQGRVNTLEAEPSRLLTQSQCDRTKPCAACCARGQPKECHFVVGEGSEYGPISQSYELRKLRTENLRLKEQLRAGNYTHASEEDRPCSPSDTTHKNGHNGTNKYSTRQKKFKIQDASDSIYFGSPGLANIINDVRRKCYNTLNLSISNQKKK
jgi:hypothetical protein